MNAASLRICRLIFLPVSPLDFLDVSFIPGLRLGTNAVRFQPNLAPGYNDLAPAGAVFAKPFQ
ncbi:MAG: hypothetical protein JJU37_16005 [Balneolaceae bacterium]|nr:hypothetical protein [Balneolaceae bacterium]